MGCDSKMELAPRSDDTWHYTGITQRSGIYPSIRGLAEESLAMIPPNQYALDVAALELLFLVVQAMELQGRPETKSFLNLVRAWEDYLDLPVEGEEYDAAEGIDIRISSDAGVKFRAMQDLLNPPSGRTPGTKTKEFFDDIFDQLSTTWHVDPRPPHETFPIVADRLAGFHGLMRASRNLMLAIQQRENPTWLKLHSEPLDQIESFSKTFLQALTDFLMAIYYDFGPEAVEDFAQMWSERSLYEIAESERLQREAEEGIDWS